MNQWTDDFGIDLPCVYSKSVDSVRVEVLEDRNSCCAPTLVRLLAQNQHTDEYEAYALLHWYYLPIMTQLMQEVFHFSVDGVGPRALPIIHLWGKRYFIDERLKELRNIDDPHDRLELRA